MKSDIEARYTMIIVPIKIPAVKNQIDVSDCINVTVKINIAVAERVKTFFSVSRKRGCAFGLLHGAIRRVGREHHVAKNTRIGSASGTDRNSSPRRTGVYIYMSVGRSDCETTLAEQAVGTFDPSIHYIGVVDARQTVDFNTYPTQHPCKVKFDQSGIANAETICMTGSALYNTRSEQCQRHKPFSIALSRCKKIFPRIDFQIVSTHFS